MADKSVQEIKDYVINQILIAQGSYEMACIRYDNVGNKEDGYDMDTQEGDLYAHIGIWNFITGEKWQETEEQKGLAQICQLMYKDDIDYFSWDMYQKYKDQVKK